jgi:hypothetical protein
MLPAVKNITVTANKKYLSRLCGSLYLNRFFFFSFREINETISIKTPSGQIDEQYTLPNKRVSIRTTTNPITERDNTFINLIKEGMNCRYNTTLANSSGKIFR